ncbi:hypothetical protein B0T25DRAFT_574519 [Lasiosphaeria hispida]|uniref:Uncharacterized protein n=1 Tax=Lasiosphaeria hispida TaxID=260671 RepID=A0AAJ0H8B1_9PEZI|nr:hypothetical protein B0T25DRAFT_574519 [Lasiosphaeria hispida]
MINGDGDGDRDKDKGKGKGKGKSKDSSQEVNDKGKKQQHGKPPLDKEILARLSLLSKTFSNRG